MKKIKNWFEIMFHRFHIFLDDLCPICKRKRDR